MIRNGVSQHFFPVKVRGTKKMREPQKNVNKQDYKRNTKRAGHRDGFSRTNVCLTCPYQVFLNLTTVFWFETRSKE